MDTTQLLGHYRLPVLQDEGLTKLLAYLFRGGPQSDESLTSTFGGDRKIITRQLVQLYRASLVHRLSDTKTWAISNAGERILQSIDIYDIASRDLIRSLTEHHTDQTFLEACTTTANLKGEGA